MSLLQKFYLLLFGSDISDKCALENKIEVWCMCWAVFSRTGLGDSRSSIIAEPVFSALEVTS